MTARARTLLLLALGLTWLVVPALLFAAQYPTWWVWIAQEQVPMTWFQSVTLVVAGVVAGLGWFVTGLLDLRHRRGLALLAVGFCALAFDERFAVHERLRDGYLAPRDVRLPLLTWIAPGDFLLLLVGVVGLVLLPVVLRSMREDRWATALLVVGVLLACITVGTDSIDPHTWSVEGERVQQTLEEVLELGAGLAFLGAVALRLLGMLEELGARARHVQPQVTDREVEPV
ncbi:hypothetical protein [Janibacter anophelis]|uniref:hypothetical protein n=1 Tax=Janibacter anophelis TaxID=319054 RepID=UPI000834DE19|nr:hypothetical protein [Janibacter anophelis]